MLLYLEHGSDQADEPNASRAWSSTTVSLDVLWHFLSVRYATFLGVDSAHNDLDLHLHVVVDAQEMGGGLNGRVSCRMCSARLCYRCLDGRSQTGGCSDADMARVVEEQEKSRGDFPGPMPVIVR